MMEWQISDQDIQAVEEILLPHTAASSLTAQPSRK